MAKYASCAKLLPRRPRRERFFFHPKETFADVTEYQAFQPQTPDHSYYHFFTPPGGSCHFH